MPKFETSRRRIVQRLTAKGWELENGGKHDIYRHPTKEGRIIVPRHTIVSPGVGRSIAKAAGWI
jgi:predicted RNA binding protein YcfA (HicA-like mRNA interferase family)